MTISRMARLEVGWVSRPVQHEHSFRNFNGSGRAWRPIPLLESNPMETP